MKRKKNYLLKKIQFHTILMILNNCFVGTNFFNLKRTLLKKIGVNIGQTSKVVGPIFINFNSNLVIGDNCWIGREFRIDGNGSVEIGDNVDIAPNVTISTGGHLIGSMNRRAGKGITYHTKIGSGSWIGTRVLIVQGSSVGQGVVVGASSLVNKDVDDNILCAGIPVKKIRELKV